MYFFYNFVRKNCKTYNFNFLFLLFIHIYLNYYFIIFNIDELYLKINLNKDFMIYFQLIFSYFNCLIIY